VRLKCIAIPFARRCSGFIVVWQKSMVALGKSERSHIRERQIPAVLDGGINARRIWLIISAHVCRVAPVSSVGQILLFRPAILSVKPLPPSILVATMGWLYWPIRSRDICFAVPRPPCPARCDHCLLCNAPLPASTLPPAQNGSGRSE
jgi:hypothetical protein